MLGKILFIKLASAPSFQKAERAGGREKKLCLFLCSAASWHYIPQGRCTDLHLLFCSYARSYKLPHGKEQRTLFKVYGNFCIVWCPCLRRSKCNSFSLWREKKACHFLSSTSAIYPSPLSCPSFCDGSHVRSVDLNWTEQCRTAKLRMKWQGWERGRIAV